MSVKPNESLFSFRNHTFNQKALLKTIVFAKYYEKKEKIFL